MNSSCSSIPKKQIKYAIKKFADLNRYFFKEDIQMAKK